MIDINPWSNIPTLVIGISTPRRIKIIPTPIQIPSARAENRWLFVSSTGETLSKAAYPSIGA